jgi:hypothetical protein
MPKPTQPDRTAVDRAIDALEILIAFLGDRGEDTGEVDLDKLLVRLRNETGADGQPEPLDGLDENSERWSSVPTRRDKP